MDSKLMKPLPKQLMLKDYLLDDLSSCSSSGFRSYPRRQCCTTVRFLLEIDLKNKYQQAPSMQRKIPPEHLLKSRLKPVPPPSATVSAFQKASVAVINTVKHLAFAGAKSPPSSKKKKPIMKTIFPRSLSRKLKRSFWKRGDHKEIYWWTSFNRLDKEELKSPVLSQAITALTVGDSNSSMSVSVSESKSKSKSNSWSDSDFTASSDNSPQASSGISEVNSTVIGNDVVALKKLGTEKVISSKIVGPTAVDVSPDSTTSSHGSSANCPNANKKTWPNEEKEQFSPVSTLDCPFDDDDEVSSPFQHRLSRMEGTTKKLMKKIKRFECLTQLEPLNLENRIVSSASESESPINNPSENETEEEEEKQEDESKALDLVQALKASVPSYNSSKLKVEKLLLDFFKERTMEACEHFKELTRGDDASNTKVLQVAKDWINGKPVDVLLDWKVQENRMAYIREIESRGEWKNIELEKQEVILDLEVEVFSSLMDELLLDIIINE